jgi:hypothetical protein
MSMNVRLGSVNPMQPVTADPWSTKTEPMVRIRADDGKTYCAIFQHTAAVYDEEGRSFTIQSCHGHIQVTGPGTGDLLKDYCVGRATNIRTNGAEITSVRVLSANEVTEAAAAAEAARLTGQRPVDPDLDGEEKTD